MPIVYLSLGSNLGDRAENLRSALRRLQTDRTDVTAVSRFYETVPVGETPEPVPLYLNCVARLETALPPIALLDHTQSLERQGGRFPTFRWGPRTIDIDILLYDAIMLASERLTVPHPRLRERAFALAPLAEIAPDLVLPDGTPIARALHDPAVQSQGLVVWTPGAVDTPAAP